MGAGKVKSLSQIVQVEKVGLRFEPQPFDPTAPHKDPKALYGALDPIQLYNNQRRLYFLSPLYEMILEFIWKGNCERKALKNLRKRNDWGGRGLAPSDSKLHNNVTILKPRD